MDKANLDKVKLEKIKRGKANQDKVKLEKIKKGKANQDKVKLEDIGFNPHLPHFYLFKAEMKSISPSRGVLFLRVRARYVRESDFVRRKR